MSAFGVVIMAKRRLWPVVTVIVIAGAGHMALGDEPFTKQPNRGNALSLTFTEESLTDIADLRRLREVVSIHSRTILERHVENGFDPGSETDACRAATALGTIRDGSNDTIRVLCKCIALRQSDGALSDGSNPLLGLPAAQALTDIGGPRVANALIDLAKQKLDPDALLLIARVLHRIDSVEVTIYRMHKASGRAKAMPPDEGRVFTRNLAQLEEWLSSPSFAKNPDYGPR